MKFILVPLISLLILLCSFCKKDANKIPEISNNYITYSVDKFCMGVDLSYVNQIEDHGGVYRDSGQVRDPFLICKQHGANLVRVRLWHNPVWTKTVYGSTGTQMYSDLADVAKTIKRAKNLGMAVNLDFHYSDTWADPQKQEPPAAWKNITDLGVLKDSMYQYTYKTLRYLNDKGLMPEMVQIGNETNCGMLCSNILAGFPDVSGCNDKWTALGEVINSGIKAVRDVSANSLVKTQVLLHVADPKNVQWWFDNIINVGKVIDFDVVGFSYYPLWHTTVAFNDLPTQIAAFKARYGRKVMILETAYPWTTEGADNYNNSFYSQTLVTGFSFTVEGQYNFLKTLTQNVIKAGGCGVMYWEPAWITSQMKDLWGTGSSWENATLFDFSGNVETSIDYMRYPYTF